MPTTTENEALEQASHEVTDLAGYACQQGLLRAFEICGTLPTGMLKQVTLAAAYASMVHNIEQLASGKALPDMANDPAGKVFAEVYRKSLEFLRAGKEGPVHVGRD